MLAADFYKSLNMAYSKVDSSELVNQGLAQSDHNQFARILRCGLAISTFSHLEGFLQGRFDELARSAAASSINYYDLSDDLRGFFTKDALTGLLNRMRFLSQANKLPYAETNLVMVAGFAALPSTLSALGFSPKGSNVNSGDVGGGLSCFGFVKPWARLSLISNSIGAGTLNLLESFDAAGRNRNSAAHDATFDLPSSDLRNHLRAIFDIATTIHVAIIHAQRQFAASPSFVKYKANLLTTPPVRFVDLTQNGKWSEKAASGRSFKLYDEMAIAMTGAASRSGNPIVVARDLSLRPVTVFTR